MRINKHSQSLLENSIKGDWDTLRKELASTQADVEAEMVLLRDADVAHLISLGGWLRAFEISTQAVASNYSEEKSRNLGRADIVEYFLASWSLCTPMCRNSPTLKTCTTGWRRCCPCWMCRKERPSHSPR